MAKVRHTDSRVKASISQLRRLSESRTRYMTFIHSREYLEAGDIVIVNSDHQCNVCVMTDSDFNNYRSGRSFHHYGGFYKRFPVRIAVPSSGYWNVTLDLAGRSANIRYNISFLKLAA
jgi:hypothetical protein